MRVKERLKVWFKQKGKKAKAKAKDGKAVIKLIEQVNPIVIGWRNYYAASYDSIWAFKKLDTWLAIKKVIPWLRKLHRTKTGLGNKKKILRKYRQSTKNWKWRIGAKDTEKNDKIQYFHRFYHPETHKHESVLQKRPLPSQSFKAVGFGTDINPYTPAGIGWWQKRATGAGYFKAETKNYWSVYKHAVVKYQNRCGLCKHPLGPERVAFDIFDLGGLFFLNNFSQDCLI